MDGGLDDQEESVRIAVRALDDMRNSASTRPSTTHTSDSDTINASNSPAFVERMSHIPFVNSALRVYEQGKASSRVVKYGVEMVESSVKTISRPVINHLPVDVNQLDEFACRQLDRLDRYRHPSAIESQGPSTSSDPSNQDQGRPKLKTKTLDGSTLENDVDTNMQRDEASSSRHHWRYEEANTPFINSPPLPTPDSGSSTPTQIGDESRSKPSVSGDLDETQVAQRSRWQAVLLEAGGLSAALSEESMQRLKYCLHWLQYATAYIDAHILFLRNFTADLKPLPSDAAESTPRPPISEEHMRRLIDVKRDIVHTIRQAVDVVSKYAGGALPEPARTRVKGFILTLPQRWASKAGGTGAGVISTAGNSERDSTVTAAASGTGATRRPGGQRRAAYRERRSGGIEGDLRSGASSRATSPSMSPRIPRTAVSKRGGGGGGDVGEGGENARVPAGTALVAAQRILALATESLDMMRNVTGVMKDSLDRAEAWVGRLRTVGIQRDTQVEGTDNSEFEFLQGNNQHHQHHRDRSSGSTQFDEPDQDIPNSPYFSATSTVWGSSIPSTPVRGTFTPVYAGGGGKGASGTTSPGMTIPIGAMSLSSRYETPRSGILSFADEEEEEGDGMVEKNDLDVMSRKTQEGQVKIIGEEEEEEGGLKMDVREG